MANYRNRLPQLDGDLFLTDGGIETTLIYRQGLGLPCFAAFDLLKHWRGRKALEDYFRSHAAIARDHQVGFIFESATWRASADWGQKLGYSAAALRGANERAILMLHDLRAELESSEVTGVISGCLGPRGDGYKADQRMNAKEAEQYHSAQADIFRDAGADLITAITMTYAEEAMGIARAAQARGIPVVISFTTETDGRLPSGQGLAAAIESVDEATDGAPAYYMINCAHPDHFAGTLEEGAVWAKRIRGIRANASTKSHAELDQMTTLDAGDPVDLALRYQLLRDRFPQINVLGGCCGTDQLHMASICKACLADRAHVHLSA